MMGNKRKPIEKIVRSKLGTHLIADTLRPVKIEALTGPLLLCVGLYESFKDSIESMADSLQIEDRAVGYVMDKNICEPNVELGTDNYRIYAVQFLKFV